MTKNVFLLLTVILIQWAGVVYAFSTSDTTISFKYQNYDVNISSSDKEFFNGRLSVSENGMVLFSMDSSFTDYVEHKFIDLNGDGSNEMLLYLTEGASPYVFHTLYIFDSKRGAAPLYTISNGELDTTVKSNPLIMVNSRMSPAVLGLWYSWYLEYKNDELIYHKPDKREKAQLGPNYDYVNEALADLKKENQICDDFAYSVFFEYIFITSKIAGNETEAERFFEENYKCENKIEALIRFKKYASDNYSWIKDVSNYNY